VIHVRDEAGAARWPEGLDDGQCRLEDVAPVLRDDLSRGRDRCIALAGSLLREGVVEQRLSLVVEIRATQEIDRALPAAQSCSRDAGLQAARAEAAVMLEPVGQIEKRLSTSARVLGAQ